MNILDQAELLDQYRTRCEQDPVNRLARFDHSYTVMGGTAPRSGPGGCTLVTLSPSADGGLPHTRPPNIICVPAYFPMNNEIMQHELLHLHQRREDSRWRGYFHKQGWEPIAEQHVPDRWLRRVRLNPDTIDQRFYAWENRWVPLPMFEREDEPDIRECIVRWWDQRSGSLLAEPPSSFSSTFGRYHPQPEHPREVNAVVMARQFRNQTWDDLERYLKTII
jgi:hypothetical protein